MKILVVNCIPYDYTVATLIEGLILYREEHEEFDFRCTETSNYGKSHYGDFVCKGDSVSYANNEADFVILTSNNPNPQLANVFNNILDPRKLIFLDGCDESAIYTNPNQFYLYFKRELTNKDWKENENVLPFTFGAEMRYFPFPLVPNSYGFSADAYFERIWDQKNILAACLFGEGAEKPMRAIIRKGLKEDFPDENIIYDCVYGGTEYPVLDTGDRHHDTYFNTLLQSSISIDAWGAGVFTGRMFESLANGCCLFYQDFSHIYFDKQFTNSKNCVIYKNRKDIKDWLEHLKDNPDQLKSIAKKGFMHLLENHTTLRRAEYLVETLKVF